MNEFRWPGDDDGFGPWFDRELAPVLAGLEARRQVLQPRFLWRKTYGCGFLIALLAVAVGVTAGLLVFTHKDPGEVITGAAVTMFLACAPILFWISAPERQFDRAFKEKLVGKLVRWFGDFRYSPKAKAPTGVIRKHNLLESFNTSSAEDSITGTHRGMKLELAELELKWRSKHSSRLVFRGLAVQLEVPWPAPCRILIRRRTTGVARWWHDRVSTDLKPVTPDNPALAERFDIYAGHEAAARPVLNSPFLRRLAGFGTADQAATAALWQDKDGRNRILLLLPGHQNRFEPPRLDRGNVNIMRDIARLKRDMSDLLDLIDGLLAPE